MKYVNCVLISVMLVGCGAKLPTEITGPTGKTGATGPTGATGSQGPSAAPISIMANGTAAAYVLSVGESSFELYLIDSKIYTNVNIDGSYYNFPAYYSGANCTGTMVASSWEDTPGNCIEYINGSYYKITASQSSAFSYQSYWTGSTCMNTSGSTSVPVGIVESTTQPYDFSSLAPLTPTF